MLAFQPALQLGDSTRFLVEATLALTARIGNHFISGQERVLEVHFQHASPSYASRYDQVFGCPVLFKQTKNALVFPRSALDVPQLHADSTVRAVLRDAAERLLQERSQQSAAERVRTLLRWENNLATIDIDRIARHLGMSARALRRRLGAEGAPLSSLIDEARCQVACRELRRPDSTIKETAELLGFSEPSAFHRAFKRWTGRTPAEFSRTTDDAPVTLIRPRAPDDEDRLEAHRPPASR
jgi:AraC-like DNA-binding protein